MAEPEAPRIEAALDAWLAPFLEVLGRKTRRRWAPLYLHGLLGPDGRKSLQPLAARLGLQGHDQLQHFVASTHGTTRPCGASWSRRRTPWSVGRTRCSSSTTPPLPKQSLPLT